MKASRLWDVFVLVVAVQAIGSYFEGEQKGTIEHRPPADLVHMRNAISAPMTSGTNTIAEDWMVPDTAIRTCVGTGRSVFSPSYSSANCGMT